MVLLSANPSVVWTHGSCLLTATPARSHRCVFPSSVETLSKRDASRHRAIDREATAMPSEQSQMNKLPSCQSITCSLVVFICMNLMPNWPKNPHATRQTRIRRHAAGDKCETLSKDIQTNPKNIQKAFCDSVKTSLRCTHCSDLLTAIRYFRSGKEAADWGSGDPLCQAASLVAFILPRG